MIPLSSPDAATAVDGKPTDGGGADGGGAAGGPDAEGSGAAVDEVRSGLLATIERELGDAVLGSHLVPGVDLWVRVATDAWTQAGELARSELGCAYFGFLSAIDWLPSPFGRYEDAEVDTPLAERAAQRDEPVQGLAGGDTRLQVLARVHSPARGYGITLKADVPDEAPAIASWVGVYPGADWHEREVWEMYGIDFVGHPDLRHLYLPGDFEGHPLRKDFPLLSRVVKPWPGIVDVEPMPEEEAPAEPEGPDAGSTSTPAPGGEASVEPEARPADALAPPEPPADAAVTADDEAPTAVEAPVETHGEVASADQLAEGASAVTSADEDTDDGIDEDTDAGAGRPRGGDAP